MVDCYQEPLGRRKTRKKRIKIEKNRKKEAEMKLKQRKKEEIKKMIQERMN